jgi:hypothetical protein
MHYAQSIGMRENISQHTSLRRSASARAFAADARSLAILSSPPSGVDFRRVAGRRNAWDEENASTDDARKKAAITVLENFIFLIDLLALIDLICFVK